MEIREIKSRLSILTILSHYGLKPDKNDFILCPFHDDHNPSLKIYTKTNTFHCFGCGATGDVIEFIQLKEASTGSACTKHESIIKAAQMVNPNYKLNIKSMENIQTPQELSRSAILMKYLQSCKAGMEHSKAAREYAESRKLNVAKLGIGFNGARMFDTWNGILKENAVKTGLLIKNGNGSYTARFKNCLVFEIKDKEGKPVAIYGRNIENNDEKRHVLMPGRLQGFYPHYPKAETERLIITESIIDAGTLMQLEEITGEYEILSAFGVNGLTREHTEAIKQWLKPASGNLLPNEALSVVQPAAGKEVIFAFDGDQAGKDGIKRYGELLRKETPEIKITYLDIPEGEDINSLAQGHEPGVFTHLLENRKQFEFEDAHPKTSMAVLSPDVNVHKSDPFSNLQINPSSNQHVIASSNLQMRPFSNHRLNTQNPEYIIFTTENLQIVLLGGINLSQLDRLRVTLKISRMDITGSYRDPLYSIRHTLDLYHSDYLEKFINKASEQLETSTSILKRAIAELTEQIEQYRLIKIESMNPDNYRGKPQARQLTEERKNRAIRYLKAPNLLQRTNEDIGKTGVIGEEINRLLMYLVFTSRLREQPLHIVSLGASGTGKTYLQEKVSELIPEQDKLEITILSENAFYYFDRKELKHKLVLIEDMDGAQEVLYPLRELQTKRKISKTIPIKDSKGNLRTITLHVEGPICLAGTTTRERLYEDNANRSLLIYIDNSQEHKELIMEYQRKLSAGKIDSKKENELKEFFKDMQSVLKPVRVRNPYAELLKLSEYVFKPLRTNAHYLAFIETVTFYHQYQRELKKDSVTGETYIETTLEDIQWANRLLKDVLLAKSDELSKAVREFFEDLKRWVKKENKESFYAKEVQQRLRMYPMKVHRYLYELESRNFIRKTGGNKKTGFEYEVYRWDEYQRLKSGTDILDQILEQIQSRQVSLTEV